MCKFYTFKVISEKKDTNLKKGKSMLPNDINL